MAFSGAVASSKLLPQLCPAVSAATTRANAMANPTEKAITPNKNVL